MLRQSLEVEVLGMDAHMFEVKQRDEELAFKVIQHVVCATLLCCAVPCNWRCVSRIRTETRCYIV